MIWIIVVSMLFQPAATQPSDASGHWEGQIVLPGTSLVIRVDLKNDSGNWSGTIDIPQQSAKGLPLEEVSVNGDIVKFAIQGVPGNPSFTGKLEPGKLTGLFTQGGATFPFSLGRDAVKPKPRPQDPVPPLPYQEEEVKFGHGDITLAGTLSLPSVGKQPFVAVVLVTGSGPQNRDEELLNHRPFRVLSDRLARAGIAVLRYDDRGFAGSTGKFEGSTSSDFCDDALSAVAFLKSRSEIDPARIGIVGHSEGGVIAPMAATKSSDVAFIVMLAGTGVPGDQLLARQMEMGLRAEGASEDDIAKQTPLQRQLIAAVVAKEPPEKLREMIRQLVTLQDPKELAGMSEAQLDTMVDAQVRQMSSRWMYYFLTYDPRTALRKLKVPVLALNGEKDFQVPPDQNLPEIEKALKEAGNTRVTIQELPGLNHLFQHCKTGGSSEYVTIDETFSEDAMKLIAEWIIANSSKQER